MEKVSKHSLKINRSSSFNNLNIQHRYFLKCFGLATVTLDMYLNVILIEYESIANPCHILKHKMRSNHVLELSFIEGIIGCDLH